MHKNNGLNQCKYNKQTNLYGNSLTKYVSGYDQNAPNNKATIAFSNMCHLGGRILANLVNRLSNAPFQKTSKLATSFRTSSHITKTTLQHRMNIIKSTMLKYTLSLGLKTARGAVTCEGQILQMNQSMMMHNQQRQLYCEY